MFQEEFASRLYAPQGSKRYSRLSVSSQLLAVTDPLFAVPRDAFLPPPKVDSRMVKVRPRYPFPPYRQMQVRMHEPFRRPIRRFHPHCGPCTQELHALLRLCFSRPNRTLRAIFRQASNLHSYCGASNASKRDAGDGGRQPRERPSPDGASRVVIGAWEQPESLPTGTPAGADGEADDLPSHLAPLLQGATPISSSPPPSWSHTHPHPLSVRRRAAGDGITRMRCGAGGGCGGAGEGRVGQEARCGHEAPGLCAVRASGWGRGVFRGRVLTCVHGRPLLLCLLLSLAACWQRSTAQANASLTRRPSKSRCTWRQSDNTTAVSAEGGLVSSPTQGSALDVSTPHYPPTIAHGRSRAAAFATQGFPSPLGPH